MVSDSEPAKLRKLSYIGGGHGQTSLVSLAKHWIESLVRSSSLARNQIHSKTAIAEAMLKSESALGIDDEITQIIEQLKADGHGQSIDKLVALFGRKFAVQAANAIPEITMDEQKEVGSEDSEVERDVQTAAKKTRMLQQQRQRDHRRNGTFDISLRKDVAAAKGANKIELLKRIDLEVRSMPEGEKFSAPMRSFATQVLDPILRCLDRHCGGDVDVFLSKWGQAFAHNKFSSSK